MKTAARNISPLDRVEPGPGAPVAGAGGPALSASMQRILTLLGEKTPLSPREIARDAFVALTTLEGGGYLRRLKQQGLIRIEGWLKNHSGFTTPLYALGAGPDCPRPRFAARDHDSRGMARIVAALKGKRNLDYREVAGLAEISANTIKNAGYMESLLQQGRIHISAWRRGRNGHLVPLYSGGGGENIARPAPLSRQEIMQRHRQRQQILSGQRSPLSEQLRALGLEAALA